MCTSTVRSSTYTLRPQTRSSSWERSKARPGLVMKCSSRRNSVGPRRAGLPLNGQLVGRQVEPQRAMLDDAGLRGPGASQQGLDPGDQLAGRERLGDVVVDAGVEALQLVGSSPRAVSMIIGNLAGVLVAAHPSGELDAAHARQHPVDDEQARQRAVEPAERLLRGRGLPDLEPGAPQREASRSRISASSSTSRMVLAVMMIQSAWSH
jgi:hypothetical protein